MSALAATLELDVRMQARSKLYSIPIDGSAPRTLLFEELSGLYPIQGEPRYSTDGTRVLFRSQVAGQDHLFSVPSDGSAPAIILNDPLPGGAYVGSFAVVPDGSGVVFTSNASGSTAWDLWLAPTDGSAAPLRLNDARTLRDNAAFEIAPDSNRVVYRSGAPTAEELLVAPLDGSQTIVALNAPVPAAGGSLGMHVAPNSETVIFTAQQPVPGRYGLYGAPIDGSGPATLLADSGASRITSLEVSADSAWVVFRSDHVAPFRDELYAVPVNGSSPPARLSPPILSGGGVDIFAISPDSSFVAHVSHAASASQAELFVGPIDGSHPAEVVNGALVPGGTVYSQSSDLAVSPDSTHVIYIAQQAAPGTRDLFASTVVPQLDSLHPKRGSFVGGTVVTIRGRGFTPTTTVAFGGIDSTSVTYVSPTELRVVTPRAEEARPRPGSARGRVVQVRRAPKSVDVTLDRGITRATTPKAFTYRSH